MPLRERAAYKEWLADLSSRADGLAKHLQNTAISAGLSGRRRGCRVAESRASSPRQGLARAFRDRRRAADTIRRPSAPACHRAARPVGRWLFPPEPPCRSAARAASARNWRCAPATAARSGPAALSGSAGLVRPPCSPSPPTHMRSERRVLLPCQGNGLRARRFRDQFAAFGVGLQPVGALGNSDAGADAREDNGKPHRGKQKMSVR